jgi:hypothetical protein
MPHDYTTSVSVVSKGGNRTQRSTDYDTLKRLRRSGERAIFDVMINGHLACQYTFWMEPCHERCADEDAAAMDNPWNEVTEELNVPSSRSLRKVPCHIRKIVLIIQTMQHSTPDPLEALYWEDMLNLAAYQTMGRTLIM